MASVDDTTADANQETSERNKVEDYEDEDDRIILSFEKDGRYTKPIKKLSHSNPMQNLTKKIKQIFVADN